MVASSLLDTSGEWRFRLSEGATAPAIALNVKGSIGSLRRQHLPLSNLGTGITDQHLTSLIDDSEAPEELYQNV